MATGSSFLLSPHGNTLLNVTLTVVSAVGMMYTTWKWLDGDASSFYGGKKKLKGESLAALQQIGFEKGTDLEVDEWEAQVAQTLVHPSKLTTTFADIGGLDPIISSLNETVIFPLLYPHLFVSEQGAAGLVSAPKGVLLYGPPGCGKTLLAKALAKESGAAFLNVSPSLITSKWFGESNKLAHAIFSLARKIQPCIIFMDEIDCFLRERGGVGKSDHEAMGMVKSEFMTCWDGLLGGSERILLLGATNRPGDIDSAFLRRLPKRYQVPLPNQTQRKKILELILRGATLEKDGPDSVDLDVLARDRGSLDGLSGSAIREVCRSAAMQPVRERLRLLAQTTTSETLEDSFVNVQLRPIRMVDFVEGDREEEDELILD